ncbi:hypothetical protein FF38_10795 [Lucilia cuprina]|uniref:Uncharacterized protein n=1 Tax=Lucilia cuprina TaxID=7375 RepID=A0A0L0BN11_LUCCU|nr:hypothetical protein FF38_10795 [Lucilia cuprina]
MCVTRLLKNKGDWLIVKKVTWDSGRWKENSVDPWLHAIVCSSISKSTLCFRDLGFKNVQYKETSPIIGLRQPNKISLNFVLLEPTSTSTDKQKTDMSPYIWLGLIFINFLFNLRLRPSSMGYFGYMTDSRELSEHTLKTDTALRFTLSNKALILVPSGDHMWNLHRLGRELNKCEVIEDLLG